MGNGKPRFVPLALLFVLHWIHTNWVHSLLRWLSLHWGDVVPAWLAVVVAGAFGWLSWCSSRRSAAAERESRAAGREAREQADRATTAAVDAAAAAERSAAAHEVQTALLQEAADAAERAPWRLTRPGGQDFRLINLTNTRKYEVAVMGEPVRGKVGTALHFDVVDGHEMVELDLFVAMQTRDRRVTVSWRPMPDHTGDPWTQRLGLP